MNCCNGIDNAKCEDSPKNCVLYPLKKWDCAVHYEMEQTFS